MTDSTKLICAWADNAIAQMGAVTDMAAWIVEYRNRLHHLDQLAPAKRWEVQEAIQRRWTEIELRAAEIRHGVG